MANKAIKRSVIKDSLKIREQLKNRFSELKLSIRDIANDAKEKDLKLSESSLSRYFKFGNYPGSLTEEQIVWLCLRYGISIHLIVGKPVLKDKRLEFVPSAYNEEECLKQLQKIFPWQNQKTLEEQTS